MSRNTSGFGDGRVAQSDLAVDSESHLGNWTVALTESRGVGREVGIVGIEREHGIAVISQVSPPSWTFDLTLAKTRLRIRPFSLP